MTHSLDGGNSSTGKPANFDASNAGTTNEHAKQGNETPLMPDPGWVQPAARIDDDIAEVIAAADSHEIQIIDRIPEHIRNALLNLWSIAPTPNTTTLENGTHEDHED